MSKGTFPDSEEWIRGGFELAPSTSEAVALSEKIMMMMMMMMMMKMKQNKIEFLKSNFCAYVNLLLRSWTKDAFFLSSKSSSEPAWGPRKEINRVRRDKILYGAYDLCPLNPT